MADNVSLADRIKALDDLKRQPIDIPEWADALDDSELFVREMSGADQVAMVKLAGDAEADLSANFDAAIFVVVRTLVDGDNQRLFTDEDADWLREKSASVVARLAEASMKVSGVTEEAVEVAAGN